MTPAELESVFETLVPTAQSRITRRLASLSHMADAIGTSAKYRGADVSQGAWRKATRDERLGFLRAAIIRDEVSKASGVRQGIRMTSTRDLASVVLDAKREHLAPIVATARTVPIAEQPVEEAEATFRPGAYYVQLPDGTFREARGPRPVGVMRSKPQRRRRIDRVESMLGAA